MNAPAYNSVDFMTEKLVTISLDKPLKQAYDLMAKHKIRHLPVTDNNGTIIGIISDRDLQRAMLPEDPVSGISTPALPNTINFDPEHSVSDFMSFPVRYVDSQMPIRVVAQMMINEKISSFLVVNDQEIAGIITTEDMLKVLVEVLAKDPSMYVKTVEGFTQVWDPLY